MCLMLFQEVFSIGFQVGLQTCSGGLQPDCDGLQLPAMVPNLGCLAVSCHQPTGDAPQLAFNGLQPKSVDLQLWLSCSFMSPTH